ncbi:hypothetical protein K439DRAFT_1640647 [Ramaria rubella]|nr:hypothetical protein K439DRAFT_1640647 [Ramaria rubella]
MGHKKWGVFPSLLALVPLFVGLSWWAVTEHYTLPTPIGPVARDDLRPSESHILSVAEHLSSTIGFRTVGTKEHAEGDAWMLQQVQRLKEECDAIVRNSHSHMECEVWRQQGSGKHRFDMMGHRLYKTYVDLTNIIVRLSNGTNAGKEHAVLVNSHIDSTPPSPGAADDALPVGVMLECIRVLIHTPNWEPKNAIIFLFNNAEESLQDGSHLYSTQDPTAKTVRAIINLEAAGTKGPELLFQATSDEMIRAYSHVPRPYGTVLANDIFSSGIILSDTDFRQFQQYLNVTGVDMAIVGHSYFYHTQKDLVEYIDPGVAQHMAENTMALLHHFTGPSSPLPSLASAKPQSPRIVYFSLLGSWFFTYPFSAASTAYTTLLGAAIVFVWQTSHAANGGAFGKLQLQGLRNFLGGLVGALVGANVVAALMSLVLGKALSWFSKEWFPIILYGPPAITGALLPQLLCSHTEHQNEHTTLSAMLLLYGALSAILQSVFEVGSAVFLFMPAVSLAVALTLNALQEERVDHIHLRTYVLAGIVPLVIGTEVWCGTADVFVPLTGRMGEQAPAEFIIASMTAFIGYYTFPLLVPFSHRFGRDVTLYAVMLFAALSVACIGIMSLQEPFDAMHPKRMYVIHSENTTTGEFHLNFAGADSSPGLSSLVQNLASTFGESHRGPEYELSPVEMNDWNGDWDTLYPFSAFLTPYRIRLPGLEGQTSVQARTFQVSAVNDVVDTTAGTRSLTLQIDHPGIIWTVIAFDAHVLKWSLDDNPPDQLARHHIKEASFYGVNTWTIDLLIKLPAEGAPKGLKVNFVGTKEAIQWPAKKASKGSDGSTGLQLLEEIHDWLEVKSGGAIDALLFGTAGGVATV